MVKIVLLVIILIGLICWLIPYLYRHIEGEVARSWIARYRAWQWYNPPRGEGYAYEADEKKQWDFIKDVLLLRHETLIVSKSMREKIRKEGKQSLLIWAVLLLVVAIIADAFRFAWITEYESAFLPLAIFVGAVMVAIGTFFTIRVNGRASSRQDWIKDVRIILAKLASSMPTSDSDQALRQRQRSKSEHKFRELELHLNPSEKMHRSLLYAISLAYDANWLKDDEVEKNLRMRNSYDWHDGKLRKAGIIRLSQVVLKQEWEQTKKLR